MAAYDDRSAKAFALLPCFQVRTSFWHRECRIEEEGMPECRGVFVVGFFLFVFFLSVGD